MSAEAARDTDFLVLGSGIAGLFFALQVAEHGSVAVVTKKQAAQAATNFAQGGIAAAIGAGDSVEDHVRDTLAAGAGLCQEQVVRMVVGAGPDAVRALMKLGARFDQGPDGEFALGREGGHGKRRVLHHRDATGREIERALLARTRAHPKIALYENHCAVDLLTSDRAGAPGPRRALGAYVLDSMRGVVERFRARITLLATGGAGKVYLYTSNPDIASGDGMAMAYRAGAELRNMEFFQFHPTCLYHPDAKSFLISEAVRGEGGVLKNAEGRAFMAAHHPQADLAPRDVVARAIDDELKRSGADSVFLDISHRDARYLRERFPNIHRRCLEFGIDITRTPIAVVPAAHYCCGGVAVDTNGETDLPGLFAAGEVTCTGMNGANRLASNSLLEGVVFAERAAREAVRRLADAPPVAAKIAPWREGSAALSSEAVVITQNWDEIRRFMWNYVGIVRSDRRLSRAARRIELLHEEIQEYYWNFKLTPALLELRNLETVAGLVVVAARSRRESRGLHYNLDHPERDDANFARDTRLRLGEAPG